jgi:hypothetical protein
MAISYPPMSGHPLPDDYRQSLLEVSGGQPASTNCELDQGAVNRLFSLDGTENDSRHQGGVGEDSAWELQVLATSQMP